MAPLDSRTVSEAPQDSEGTPLLLKASDLASDPPFDLQHLIDRCNITAHDKGWYEDGVSRNIGEVLMLFVTEIAEAMEEFRVLGPDKLTEIYYSTDAQGNQKPEGYVVEIADLLIRAFNHCGEFHLPIHEALALKMDYNDTRPVRHGGKFA